MSTYIYFYLHLLLRTSATAYIYFYISLPLFLPTSNTIYLPINTSEQVKYQDCLATESLVTTVKSELFVMTSVQK